MDFPRATFSALVCPRVRSTAYERLFERSDLKKNTRDDYNVRASRVRITVELRSRALSEPAGLARTNITRLPVNYVVDGFMTRVNVTGRFGTRSISHSKRPEKCRITRNYRVLEVAVRTETALHSNLPKSFTKTTNECSQLICSTTTVFVYRTAVNPNYVRLYS